MKNNLKKDAKLNSHVKNAVMFSSCLLGMLGVGAMTNQSAKISTVHADTVKIDNQNNSNADNSNQNNSATQQSSLTSQSSSTNSVNQSSSTNSINQSSSTNLAVQQSSATNSINSASQSSSTISNSSAENTSTKISSVSQTNSNSSVANVGSEFIDNGIKYEIGSDGVPFQPVDSATMSEEVSEQAKTYWNNNEDTNNYPQYDYESAVKSANASNAAEQSLIDSMFAAATGESDNADSLAFKQSQANETNNSNSANNNLSNSNSAQNNAVQNSYSNVVISQANINLPSFASGADNNPQIASNNVSLANSYLAAWQTQLNQDNSAQNTATNNKAQAQSNVTSLNSAISGSLAHLNSGENLDQYKANLSSAYEALNVAQSAISSADSEISLANSSVNFDNSNIANANQLVSSANQAVHISNLTVQTFQTKDVSVPVGGNYDPSMSFVSAVNSDGQKLTLQDFTINGNVNTSKGLRPNTYIINFAYHNSVLPVQVNVFNDSAMTLRRDDQNHPYYEYAGDDFNPTSLITSLKDDAGNNVDPEQAIQNGDLIITKGNLVKQFSANEPGGYFLTYNYYPDGNQYAPVFTGNVKTYYINQSSLTSQPLNLTVGDNYDLSNAIISLKDSHGNVQTYDNAIKNGSLKIDNNNVNVNTPGTYPVKLTYFDNQYTININVLNKSDLGLNNPAEIKAGTQFNLANGVSVITDVKGNPVSFQTVKDNGLLQILGLDQFNSNIPGNYTINYRYNNQDHNYQIKVDSQKSLTFAQNPTAIFTGTNLNPASLFKQIINDDGQSISYDEALKNGLDAELDNVNTNKAGTYIGKFNYGNLSYPIEIQVEDRNGNNLPNINNGNNANNSNNVNNNNNANNNANDANDNNVIPSNNGGNSFNIVFPTDNSGNNNSSNNKSNDNSNENNHHDATNNKASFKEDYVGSPIDLYINNSAPTYRFDNNEQTNNGVYKYNQNGYSKVNSQLVKINNNLYYKLPGGKYIVANQDNNKYIIKANRKQVQVANKNGVKAYRHLFKHSKPVQVIKLGTVIHIDKIIMKGKQLYYKIINNRKSYFIKSNTNSFNENVGVIPGMDLYLHNESVIYKNADLTKPVKKVHNKPVKVILKKVNGNGIWEVTGGYINGKQLLTKGKIFNDIFGK